MRSNVFSITVLCLLLFMFCDARPKEGDKTEKHDDKLVQSKSETRTKKHVDTKHQKDKRYGLKNAITDAADLIDRNLLNGNYSTTQKTVDAADSLSVTSSTQSNGTGPSGPLLFPGEPSATDATTPRVFLFNTSTTHPPDVTDARAGHKKVQTILDDNKRSKNKKKAHVQKKELKNPDVKKKDKKPTVDHI